MDIAVFKLMHGLPLYSEPDVDVMRKWHDSLVDGDVEWSFSKDGVFQSLHLPRDAAKFLLYNFTFDDDARRHTKALQHFGSTPENKERSWRDIIEDHVKWTRKMADKQRWSFEDGDNGSTYDHSCIQELLEYHCYEFNGCCYAAITVLDGGSPFSAPGTPFIFTIVDTDNPVFPETDRFHVYCENGCWAAYSDDGGRSVEIDRRDNEHIARALDPHYPRSRQATLEHYENLGPLRERARVLDAEIRVLQKFGHEEAARQKYKNLDLCERYASRIRYDWIWRSRRDCARSFIKIDNDEKGVCAFCGSKIEVNGE
jgi:hypothetical protein